MTFEDRIERGSFTGTTSADLVAISLPGMSAAMVQLTGTFSATVTFEVLVDEGSSPTWKAVSATNVTTGTAATTATAAGIYSAGVSGARQFRVRCSGFVSGTVVVAVNVSRGSASGGASSGGGGAVTVADGADVALGTTTDAGVVTDTTGTVIGFLRGNIIKWIAQALLLGAVNETAPATDTASSGLNGRLQRIAQRITSLIALVPAALTGSGNFKTSIAESTATVTTAGTKTNNNAAPGATNTGTLPSVANAAAQSWTEGNQVSNSVDLSGFQRGIVHGTTAGGASATGVNPVLTGFVGTGATIRNWTASNSVTATAGNDVPGVGPLVYDSSGALWNRQRDTNSADNSSGTGIAGAGMLGWDGSVYRRASTDTSGRQIVIGAAATGAAVAGNPVLMAGSDGTNAQAVMIGTGASARVQMVGITSGVGGSGDGLGVAGFSSMYGLTALANGLCNMPHLYNGTTADRMRANEDRILLASALRSSTSGPTALVTYNHRAIYFVLDTTVHTGSGIVKLVVDFIDPASGKAINLLTGANVIAATTNVYKIGIGLTAAANLVAVEYLARNLQWTVTLVSGTSVTYSLGCCLMPA